MDLKDLFRRLIGGEESAAPADLDEYTEVPLEGGTERHLPPGKYVKVFKLRGFADVDHTAAELGDGNIIILDIKPLAERSMNELKHAVDEIKNTALSMGGDIAGLSEYHLIMTPPGVRVERSGDSKAQDFDDTMERVRKSMAR
jgi:SepF-like predicted cell division protein (DUF552 family)